MPNDQDKVPSVNALLMFSISGVVLCLLLFISGLLVWASIVEGLSWGISVPAIAMLLLTGIVSARNLMAGVS